MCEPMTAALTLAAIGTGMQAYGTYQEGKAESEANKYNAEIMRQKAKDAAAAGEKEKQKAALQNKQLLGRQMARLAANGVDLTSDSPLEIFQQTAEWGERDRQEISDNTAREVWGYNTQANLYDAAAKNAKLAGKIGAFSTLLNGSANLLFKGNDAGLFGNKPAGKGWKKIGSGAYTRGGGSSSATVNGKYQGSTTW